MIGNLPRKTLFLDPARFTPGLDLPLVSHMRRLGASVNFGACRPVRDEGLEGDSPDFEFFRISRRLPGWLIRNHTIRRILRGLEYPFDLWRLRRHIRARGYQVVHLTWLPLPKMDLQLIRSLSKQRMALVMTACNAKDHEAAGIAPLWKEALHLADSVICLTEHVKTMVSRATGVEPGKIAVIPRGDQEGYAPSATDSQTDLLPVGFRGHPIAVCLGNIRPYKGIPELLRAWPRVLLQLPEAKLIIAGALHASCAAEVHQALDELGSHRDTVLARFEFLSIAEYYGYLASATVLVQPYRDASQSGNTVQAYRLGVPVVCTRVGGLPEMVEPGVTGAVVEPGDTEALGEGIVQVLHQNLQGQMAAACRMIADSKYAWPAIAQATLEVYERAISSCAYRR